MSRAKRTARCHHRATDVEPAGLVFVRLVTSLGLGVAATCFVSLAFAPRHVRGLTVASWLALVPMGRIFGAIITSTMLEHTG